MWIKILTIATLAFIAVVFGIVLYVLYRDGELPGGLPGLNDVQEDDNENPR